MLTSRLLKTLLATVVLVAAASASASNIAIVSGSYYTPNLKNALVAAGNTVSEITTYDAVALSSYDSVIQYGNSFYDFAALETYATAGGRVIETPWFWLNYSPTSALDIFTHGGSPQFHGSFGGVTVLAPADPLLAGVTFPGASGLDIGRTTGNGFVAGVTQIANWADGTAFIGQKALGAGTVIGINLQVITSDTAYNVIDQAWATQLFVNATNGTGGTNVPEPTSIALLGLGLAGLFFAVRRKA